MKRTDGRAGPLVLVKRHFRTLGHAAFALLESKTFTRNVVDQVLAKVADRESPTSDSWPNDQTSRQLR